MDASTAVPAAAGRRVSPTAAPGGVIPVLYVHSGRDWIRGSERCLLDLIAGLDRARFRPVLWCDTPTLAREAVSLGATVELSGRIWDDTDRLLPTRAQLREARRILHAHGVRLVHANNEIPLKALLPAARMRRVPVLAHLHLPTTADERCYLGAHQVALSVAVSRAAAQGLLDDGTPPSRVGVIYNGVDPARLSTGDASALRAALGIAPGDVVVVAVGSLIPRKGIDVVLDAFASLRARAPRARLLVIGGGPERETLEARSRALGLDGIAHFLGERADVGAILRDAADVFVSAAREEAFPLTPLEAALFGLPVVASDIAPHHESVVVEETGLLVPRDDATAFADALDRLVRDDELRRRLGTAGRARVEQGFLTAHYVASFAATYEALLARPSRTYGWLGGSVWPRVYWRWLGGMIGRRLRRR